MSDAQREMTLEEWCAQLPDFHLVNRQLRELKATHPKPVTPEVEDRKAMHRAAVDKVLFPNGRQIQAEGEIYDERDVEPEIRREFKPVTPAGGEVVLAILRQMQVNSAHFRNDLPALADHHEGEHERELAAIATVASMFDSTRVSGGEIVAWTRTDAITDDAGYPIGMDEPRVVWGSEHPDTDEHWSPLYNGPHPPVADAALHDAVMSAVVKLSSMAEAAPAECYAAHDILRQALIDYADRGAK